LFVVFTGLALQGFGGVLAVAQRVLVEQRGWLTKAEFLKLLALAQMLPGPNVVNLSLMVGDRYFGLRGALTALAGMLLLPLVIVLALTIAYTHTAQVPQVAGALRGMGAVAAGLIIGTAISLAGSLRNSPLGVPMAALLGSAALVAVALLRWPLGLVLLALGCLAVLIAYVQLRRR
jgi:chromate transporter